MSKEYQVVDVSGVKGNNADFPIALIAEQVDMDKTGYTVVDPVFTDAIVSNLYGRLMTLVEATTDSYKVDAVKDLFKKELNAWSEVVYADAREIATGGNHSGNVYTRSLIS